MRRVVFRFALLAALICCGGVQALGLAVSPVRVDLNARQPIASLTLNNGEDQDKTVQAEVVRWRHENGVDVLEPSEDIVVSPPMFRLAAGASQIVRLGLDDVPADINEASYRLVLQELPQDKAEPGNIQMLLRLSLPVFVAPSVKPIEKLDWQLAANADGSLDLQVNNRGNLHTRIVNLSLRAASGGEAIDIGSVGDVLAGEQRHWQLKPATRWRAGTAMLAIKTHDGTHEVTLPFVER